MLSCALLNTVREVIGMADVPIIELKNVRKAFFGVQALDGMNLTINKGEMRSLIGENGCGKSTMIKIISGFYELDEGELWINGKSFRKIAPIDAMREGIQVIYQDFSLFPNLTVAENICMSKFIESDKKMIDWKETRRQAEEQLAQLNIQLDPSTLVSQISVAEKQIVAICRALMQDCKLIIMDEPTTALTRKEVEALYVIVADLMKRGISVLFVSHKLDEVETVSTKVTVMRNGKNVFEGDTCDLSKEKMVYYMTGREIRQERYLAETKSDTPVLQVKNLSNGIDFYNVDFDLYGGEVMGITGLMGSGRSEIAQALFGLIPYTGQIHIKGQAVSIGSVEDAIAKGIAYVPEDRGSEGLHMTCSIGDNSIVCVLDQLINRIGIVDGKRKDERMVEILSGLTIAGMHYEKEVRLLSGGNQQKVLLVKWLGTNPDILILNCPTVGVDVGSKSDIHEVIRGIARSGMAVIVISDDIPEIVQVCNRVMIVRDGYITGELDIRETSVDDLEELLVDDGQRKVAGGYGQ